MLSITVKRIGNGFSQGAEKGIQRQLPFAIMNTINRTLNDIQTSVRKETLAKRFTVAPQKVRFVENLVKRRSDDIASKQSLIGRVRIEGPENDASRSVILARHERGGTSHMVTYPLFIPTKDIRPNDYALVPKKYYPSALGLSDRRAIDGGFVPGSTRGKRRAIPGLATPVNKLRKAGVGATFILKPKANLKAWGIYQRVGSGKGGDSLKMLWAFRTQIRLKPRLDFYGTSRRVVADRITGHFQQALAQALATAK
jgi:hypothetical protein